MARSDDTVSEDTRPARGGAPLNVAGSAVDAGATTESGPLGRVDPVDPVAPSTVRRPPLGLATMTVVVGFVALIAMLLVLGSIADGVRNQEVFALDNWATPFLHAIASPGLDWVMLRLTDLGSSVVIVPVFVVAIAGLVWKHRYGAASFLTVSIGGSLFIAGAMKVLFERPRPQLSYAPVLPDYSFPSGHTMNAVIFYVALALIAWSVFGRRIGIVALTVAVVLAVGVGVSRIYLGYHYLTDVVGGFLAGVTWLLVVGAAFRARPTWWSWGSRPVVPGSRAPGSQ
jgi:membrane-associated phospholipid phosphatase